MARRDVRLLMARTLLAGVVVAMLGPVVPPSKAATPGWTWQMSGIHGGGTAQVIATDPVNTGYATVGGDSWGVYNTTTAGNDWLPAMKGLGVNGQNDVARGDFFFMGMAYSKKFPDRVYALTGKLGNIKAGGFGYVKGNSYYVVTRSVSGAEPRGPCGDRTQRPRCTGNRVIVDYDTGSGTEFLYAATGNGGGVVRSLNGGVTWAVVGLRGVAGITGMALDPSDRSVLYVGTRANGAYRLSNIRVGGVTAQLSGPSRFEEVAAIGNSIYAAADTAGVYILANGTSWTKLGGSFFGTTAHWSAIGGSGNTIYVGGANTAAGQTIGKSTDGGTTWTWLPSDRSKIDITPWGTSSPWWLAQAVPSIKLGCFDGVCYYDSTAITVDQLNPNIVYSAGRSGVWKSEDGGATWRPAVKHLAGTMHSNLAAGSGGQAAVNDVDWSSESTSDYFQTVQQGGGGTLGGAALSLNKNGHTYQVTLGVPRGILLDGQSIANEYFRAGVNRPRDIDVSSDGQYIYIAQYGGGVMVGRQVGAPSPTPTATGMSLTPTLASSGGYAYAVRLAWRY